METAQVSRRLDAAVTLVQGGRKREAELQLRDLVAKGARHPRACMVLGVLCGERGDLEERRLWLRQARRLEEAGGEPLSLRLLLNQLVDALEHGEPETALAYGEEALALYPEHWEAHLHQAHVSIALRQLKGARHQLDQVNNRLQALDKDDPNALKAWRQLAQAETRVERPDASIEAYNRALALEPNHLPSLLAISRLLMSRGSIDQAMPWLMNALAMAPENTEALCCTGIALKMIDEIEQAKDLFRQALAIDADHVESAVFLAGCLSDQGRCEEASTHYRHVLTLDPGNAGCRIGLGTCLRSVGDVDGALAIQRALLEEAPQDQGAFYAWMFTSSISDNVPPAEVLDTAQVFWAGQEVKNDLPGMLPCSPRAAGRPLRVGLLSADIGNHVVGLFLDPLLRHHDPTRCQLDLLSMRRLYDHTSEELAGLADHVFSLEGLPDDEARALLKQQSYDLIVDTSGYTRGSGLHLLAERCAPVQAHYIGYHATTGLPTLDAFIGDQETAAADLQDQFSECLWRLPRPWLAFSRELVFPEATPLMQTDRPVLGAFCQVSKISDTTLAFWAEALRRVPEAVLVLKDRCLAEAEVRQRLEDRLKTHGVQPGRLTFIAPLPLWSDHVYHYNYLDVALDTTPWSSATTGFEALSMGVPLVAIRGNRMASRMSSSLAKGLGHGEWIGTSLEAYADIVENLCADLSALRKEKAARQQETFASPLFDGPDLANSVMDLFRDLYANATKPG